MFKVHLMEQRGKEVPSSIHFDVGYYEKCSNKCWLVTAEDLGGMSICCGTHDNTPPALPMFRPPLKHPKKETFTDAMTSAAVAFANAISPSTQETPSPQHHQPLAMLSPMKSVNLQMKNLPQLRFVQ